MVPTGYTIFYCKKKKTFLMKVTEHVYRADYIIYHLVMELLAYSLNTSSTSAHSDTTLLQLMKVSDKFRKHFKLV